MRGGLAEGFAVGGSEGLLESAAGRTTWLGHVLLRCLILAGEAVERCLLYFTRSSLG
jgi:hypothetical protein